MIVLKSYSNGNRNFMIFFQINAAGSRRSFVGVFGELAGDQS